MCGIAALFSLKENSSFFPLIQSMTGIINHRGPDDEGFVIFSSSNASQALPLGGKDTPHHVLSSSFPYCPKKLLSETPSFPCYATFGHRRLSILDLSAAGHQPLCVNDTWITYNGEVYNYLELRKELEALGRHFKTNTDTEVIVQAYLEWGQHFLDKLNGMFSFVLYDLRKQRALAVRDRFGVKPLYYWISPHGFIAFASEIKQFTVLPGWKATLNGQCVYDFLNWGLMDHTSETCFSGVMQLRGGEYLEFNPSQLKLHQIQPKQWYALKKQPFQGSLQEAGIKLRQLLQDSIKLRLRADVDVGSCLSGGLDSSSIVCLADRFLQENKTTNRQKTFSACSEVKRFDERSFIDIVVKTTSVDAHYVYPSVEQIFHESPHLTWHQDEPFTSTSMLAQWLIFKAVKETNVKVMLDGQGADEQLAGYHGFFGNRFYELFCSLRWKRLFKEMKISSQLHLTLKPFPLLLNKFLPDFLLQPLRRWNGKTATKSSWLNVSSLNATERDPYTSEKNKSVFDQSLLQLSKTSLPMLLHFEDRASMAHSIESRTPFLDYRLVEFNLGLPSDFKISNGLTKCAFREGMKGILPEEIRNRRDKLGFVTAEEEWLKNQHPQRFLKAIDQAIECSRGVLSPTSRNIVEEIIQGKRPFSYLPWRMISFGEWIKRFSVSL